MNIYDDLTQRWHHDASQPPPGNDSHQQQEEHMTLAAHLAPVREALEGVAAWHAQVGLHLDEALAVITAFEQSPLVQALQAAVLPPEVDAALAAVVHVAGTAVPQPQPAVTGPQPEPAAQ